MISFIFALGELVKQNLRYARIIFGCSKMRLQLANNMGRIQQAISRQFIAKKELIGITQKELARKLHRSEAYISELLNGDKRWNEDDIEGFCDAFGITLADLEPRPGPWAKDAKEEQELHWKLSRILREGSEKERNGIILNIEYVFGHMIQLRKDQAKGSTARKTKPIKHALVKARGSPGSASVAS